MKTTIETPADALVRKASRRCPACGKLKPRGDYYDWVGEQTFVGVKGRFLEYQICRACRKAGRRPSKI